MVFFVADNGGCTGYSSFAGNNYPHRGGKSSDFEGGVRVSGFVAGGALPASQRGRRLEGLMHVADLYATFTSLGGIDPADDCPGVPSIDSLNMWPYIIGSTSVSPRTEVPLSTLGWHGHQWLPEPLGSHAAVIVGQYKLVTGSQAFLGFWTGEQYPNASQPCDNITHGSGQCGEGCGDGCLFDIFADPGEHHDLARLLPQVKTTLLARLQRMKAESYQTDGDDSPLNVSSLKWTRARAEKWKSEHGGFWGPYGIGMQCDTAVASVVV